ncbi:MAG: hypothetical protein RLN70_12225, partial [Rhodospirillaceae bacterium]
QQHDRRQTVQYQQHGHRHSCYHCPSPILAAPALALTHPRGTLSYTVLAHPPKGELPTQNKVY